MFYNSFKNQFNLYLPTSDIKIIFFFFFLHFMKLLCIRLFGLEYESLPHPSSVFGKIYILKICFIICIPEIKNYTVLKHKLSIVSLNIYLFYFHLPPIFELYSFSSRITLSCTVSFFLNMKVFLFHLLCFVGIYILKIRFIISVPDIKYYNR